MGSTPGPNCEADTGELACPEADAVVWGHIRKEIRLLNLPKRFQGNLRAIFT